MSDNRPLSPHLTIYRPYITMVSSIMNRITGVGMSLAAILIVWWLLAAAAGPEAFATAEGWITSLLGDLVMLGSLWALWYHFINGLRHLTYDTGNHFDVKASETSAWGAFALSFLATALTLLVI